MLNLMVNGLRAGYSTMQAMESISKELPPPVCDEFRRVVQEMQIGIPMETALDNLLRRIPSPDLDFVVTAINVQREVGGNLSEILDSISFTIRERVRIKGEIRVLTSQVRASGTVLSLIPEHARRVGLVGAAVTDHPRIQELIRQIVATGREIGISSLRADRLNRELVHLLAQGGYKTLTTALDGASQRLRLLVDRRIEERHLIQAAELVRSEGLQRLKLYVMVGFPGETGDDIEELVRFSMELSKIAPLALSISPFVSKRNTPLNRAPFEGIAALNAKLAHIREALKGNLCRCGTHHRMLRAIRRAIEGEGRQ
jgi:hypothetical protein